MFFAILHKKKGQILIVNCCKDLTHKFHTWTIYFKDKTIFITGNVEKAYFYILKCQIGDHDKILGPLMFAV